MKYDQQKKLWIYLHKNRSVDYPPWNEHLKKLETKYNPDEHITTDREKDMTLNREIQVDRVEYGNISNKVVMKGRKKEKLLKLKRKHN